MSIYTNSTAPQMKATSPGTTTNCNTTTNTITTTTNTTTTTTTTTTILLLVDCVPSMCIEHPGGPGLVHEENENENGKPHRLFLSKVVKFIHNSYLNGIFCLTVGEAPQNIQ